MDGRRSIRGASTAKSTTGTKLIAVVIRGGAANWARLTCFQAAGLKLVAAWMFRGLGARPASQSSVAGVGLVLIKTQWGRVTSGLSSRPWS